MTSGLQPRFSGAPQPVSGVTGGPAVLGGQISNDPNDGSVVVAPNPGNVLQVRKGSQPTALQIYEYFHTNIDYARLALNSQANGPFQLSVETAPSSVIRDLQIGANGNLWQFHGSNGEFFPVSNNLFDIGDATHRVNNLYVNHLIPNPIASYSVTGVAGSPSTTSSSYVDVPDMILNLNSTVVTNVLVWFSITMSGNVVGNAYNIGLNINNGADAFNQLMQASATINAAQNLIAIGIYNGIPAGANIIKGRWAVQSGTLTGVATLRNMLAIQYAA